MSAFRTALLAAASILTVATSASAAPLIYPNSGTEAPSPGAFFAGLNGTLRIYFTGLAGGFSVFGGVRVNGVDRPYALNNQTSAYGDYADLGTVNVGDSLVPYIFVETTGHTFYSDPSLNFDGVNHAWQQSYGGDSFIPASFVLSFEDLDDGGDFNYTDYGMSITVQKVPAVPEPASWAMMIAGFGLAGVALRRRTSMKAALT